MSRDEAGPARACAAAALVPRPMSSRRESPGQSPPQIALVAVESDSHYFLDLASRGCG